MSTARPKRRPRPPSSGEVDGLRALGGCGGNAPRHPRRRSGRVGGRGQTGPASVHAGRRRPRLPGPHRIHERRRVDADGGHGGPIRQPVLRPHGQKPFGAADRQFLPPFSVRRRPGHARTRARGQKPAGTKIQALLTAGDGSHMSTQIAIRPLLNKGLLGGASAWW